MIFLITIDWQIIIKCVYIYTRLHGWHFWLLPLANSRLYYLAHVDQSYCQLYARSKVIHGWFGFPHVQSKCAPVLISVHPLQQQQYLVMYECDLRTRLSILCISLVCFVALLYSTVLSINWCDVPPRVEIMAAVRSLSPKHRQHGRMYLVHNNRLCGSGTAAWDDRASTFSLSLPPFPYLPSSFPSLSLSLALFSYIWWR